MLSRRMKIGGHLVVKSGVLARTPLGRREI
jgi:hypothetical protein